jgi:NitT/TauT family transport system substrate-binding protein
MHACLSPTGTRNMPFASRPRRSFLPSFSVLWRRCFAAAGLLGAVLLGHGNALAQSAAAKPLKPVTIALGTQVINVTYPWLTLPIALGYWRDEGYDVKLVTVAGSLQGIQQMVAGGVEFAQVNSTGLIQANTDSNVPVRGLMGTGVIDWGVGVMQDGPIKSVADLKGKKIGIFSLGTGGMPLLKGYLRANGLNPDTDVQIIATGAGAPALEALKSDRVQALMFWASALAGFQNTGTRMRVLHDASWRAMPDFTFATMQKTIDSDPAMVEAISRGAAKATLYAMTNPDCTRRIHWKAFPSTRPTGAEEATLAAWDLKLLDTQLETMRQAHELHGGKAIGAMNVAAYARMEDFMFKEGLIKRTVPAETLLISRPGFLDAINRFDRNAVIEAAKGCKGL